MKDNLSINRIDISENHSMAAIVRGIAPKTLVNGIFNWNQIDNGIVAAYLQTGEKRSVALLD